MKEVDFKMMMNIYIRTANKDFWDNQVSICDDDFVWDAMGDEITLFEYSYSGYLFNLIKTLYKEKCKEEGEECNMNGEFWFLLNKEDVNAIMHSISKERNIRNYFSKNEKDEDVIDDIIDSYNENYEELAYFMHQLEEDCEEYDDSLCCSVEYHS